ncbi:MAG: MFS transporter [Eubacteriales bacterium]
MTRDEIKKRRYMMVFGALAIFFTGFPHVWSIYQPYVMDVAGWTEGQSSMCFYLVMCTFVLGNIIGGRIQDRYSPRIAIVVGGGIFSMGVLISSFVIGPSIVPMYISYGVMQGIGQGMIYTTIISTAQKWFPNKLGFASGVVVTANGLCGLFLAPLSRYLLEKGGPQLALCVIGVAITLSWIFISIFFSLPNEITNENPSVDNEDVTAHSGYTSHEMIKTKKYYYLVATMLFGLMAYLLMSPYSQLYQTSVGVPSTIAVSAVMAGSVVNAMTRLTLPTLADKVGRVICVQWTLIVCAITMYVLAFAQSWGVTITIIIIYGCYGGIMGSFPSLTSSIFGMKYSGENYGYVMFGLVLATLGAPIIRGFVDRIGGTMNIVFLIGGCCSIIALIFVLLLKKEMKNS